MQGFDFKSVRNELPSCPNPLRMVAMFNGLGSGGGQVANSPTIESSSKTLPGEAPLDKSIQLNQAKILNLFKSISEANENFIKQIFSGSIPLEHGPLQPQKFLALSEEKIKEWTKSLKSEKRQDTKAEDEFVQAIKDGMEVTEIKYVLSLIQDLIRSYRDAKHRAEKCSEGSFGQSCMAAKAIRHRVCDDIESMSQLMSSFGDSSHMYDIEYKRLESKVRELRRINDYMLNISKNLEAIS